MTVTVTQDKAQQVLREVINCRGYVVIGTPSWAQGFSIGDITHELFAYHFDAAFRVMEITDLADWIAQSDLIAELRPQWVRRREVGVNDNAKFYRVVSD